MSSNTQIEPQVLLQPDRSPFERNCFEIGGVLTKVGDPDPLSGLREIRLRGLYAGRESFVYPLLYVRGPEGMLLGDRIRLNRPVLLRGHLEIHRDESSGTDQVGRRYVGDQVLSINSTNVPGTDFDRNIVEYGGPLITVGETKSTGGNKSTYRKISLGSAGGDEGSLPVGFMVFGDTCEAFDEIELGDLVSVQAFEDTYRRRGSNGTRMCRSTNVGRVLASSPPEIHDEEVEQADPLSFLT